MRKFSALYRNEITKVVHKPLYIVFVALTVVSMLFAGLVLKLDISAGYSDNGNPQMYDIEIENLENDLKIYIEDFKQNASDMEKKLVQEYLNGDGTVDDERYNNELGFNYGLVQFIPDSLAWPLGRIEYLKVLKEYFPDSQEKNLFNLGIVGISTLDSSSKLHFLNDTATRLSAITASERYEQIKADVFKDCPHALEYFDIYTIDLTTSGIAPETYPGEKEKLKEILRESDFSVYIDAMNEQVKKDESLTEEQKKIKLEGNDLLRKAYRNNMSQQSWNELNEKLGMLSNYKIQLNAGKADSGRKFTADEIKNLELQISEITLGISKRASGFGGNQTGEEASRVGMIASVGASIAQIALIMLGGMIIAEEIQTGSIKTLIIAPVKRRKIVGAKFAMLVTFALVEALIVFLTLMLVCAVFGFGFAKHVFVLGGSAHAMNTVLFYLLYILLSFSEAFFAGCFAFMLSALFRNAGAAIALSMVGTFVLGESVNAIRLMGEDSIIIKHLYEVLPPANFQLQEKMFATTLQSESTDFFAILNGNFGINGNSLTVSAIYVAVFIVLFVFTAFQSFNKRDIK